MIPRMAMFDQPNDYIESTQKGGADATQVFKIRRYNQCRKSVELGLMCNARCLVTEKL